MAWLKLAGSNQNWNSRGHFFAAAAESMRRILIDRARRRNRERHGAGLQRIDLDSVDLATTTDDDTLLRVNEAWRSSRPNRRTRPNWSSCVTLLVSRSRTPLVREAFHSPPPNAIGPSPGPGCFVS